MADVAELASRLEAVALRVMPQASNNSYAKSAAVRQLIAIVTDMTVEEFSELRNGLNDGLNEDGGNFDPLPRRLSNLSHRLEQEGQYVDANIVWLALEALTNKAAA